MCVIRKNRIIIRPKFRANRGKIITVNKCMFRRISRFDKQRGQDVNWKEGVLLKIIEMRLEISEFLQEKPKLELLGNLKEINRGQGLLTASLKSFEMTEQDHSMEMRLEM